MFFRLDYDRRVCSDGVHCSVAGYADMVRLARKPLDVAVGGARFYQQKRALTKANMNKGHEARGP